MKISDFQIGTHFQTCTGQIWRCTDVGLRTVLAIEIDPDRDEHWYSGPPYAVTENVFDEKDIAGCYRNETEALHRALSDFNRNVHPGYSSEVTKELLSARRLHQSREYPSKRLLRIDRIDASGEIYHPYSAEEVGGKWQILVYLPFLQTFTNFPEETFIRMRAATDQDFRQRKALQENS